MTHLFAVIGLAIACALWVVLQRATGDPSAGAAGRCGACEERERCETRDSDRTVRT